MKRLGLSICLCKRMKMSLWSLVSSAHNSVVHLMVHRLAPDTGMCLD